MELGAEKSFVHVPLELLTLVPGQRCIKKLNEAQTAQMIRATARSAPDKKFDIQNIVSRINRIMQGSSQSIALYFIFRRYSLLLQCFPNIYLDTVMNMLIYDR